MHKHDRWPRGYRTPEQIAADEAKRLRLADAATQLGGPLHPDEQAERDADAPTLLPHQVPAAPIADATTLVGNFKSVNTAAEANPELVRHGQSLVVRDNQPESVITTRLTKKDLPLRTRHPKLVWWSEQAGFSIPKTREQEGSWLLGWFIIAAFFFFLVGALTVVSLVSMAARMPQATPSTIAAFATAAPTETAAAVETAESAEAPVPTVTLAPLPGATEGVSPTANAGYIVETMQGVLEEHRGEFIIVWDDGEGHHVGAPVFSDPELKHRIPLKKGVVAVGPGESVGVDPSSDLTGAVPVVIIANAFDPEEAFGVIGYLPGWVITNVGAPDPAPTPESNSDNGTAKPKGRVFNGDVVTSFANSGDSTLSQSCVHGNVVANKSLAGKWIIIANDKWSTTTELHLGSKPTEGWYHYCGLGRSAFGITVSGTRTGSSSLFQVNGASNQDAKVDMYEAP